MGRRLEARGLLPGLILTSTAARALKTAELVGAELKPSAVRIERDDRLYLATPGELLGVIAELDDSIDAVMLVGHNPGLTELVNMLVPSLGLTNLPTAGVVAIDCETAGWAQIDSGRFTLRCFDYPKNAAPVT